MTEWHTIDKVLKDARMLAKHIVFLPGLGTDERLFNEQLRELKKKYTTQVIVCDKHTTVSDHVDYVLKQVPKSFVLVGHSLGGWIAQWMAIKAPERISHLVLIGTGTGGLTPTLKSLFNEMLEAFKNNAKIPFFDKLRPQTVSKKKIKDEKLMDTIKTMSTQFSDQGLINQALTDLHGGDTTEELSNIMARTLVIHGQEDKFYENDMQIISEKIPNANYIEIPDCGHMLPLEKGKTISTLIKLWINMN